MIVLILTMIATTTFGIACAWIAIELTVRAVGNSLRVKAISYDAVPVVDGPRPYGREFPSEVRRDGAQGRRHE